MTHTDDSQAGATPQDDDIVLPTTADLMAEIASLKAELNRYRDLAGRAQADLQNAKARVEREADDLRKFASESLVRRILPTLDNFQRAFQHIPEDLKDHEWVKGVSAIEADLMKQMADVGLKRMQSLHQPVDANKHDPLMVGPGAADTVIEVLEEGYELNGKVLRPAKVKVGDGSAQ
ncbi:nucleotide exchange factor GrpE [Candidatus Peribacteria bacterium]|nr:MAG: nucleotide exchange factor GrpE [Candidatus Peribacteria bacterium]